MPSASLGLSRLSSLSRPRFRFGRIHRRSLEHPLQSVFKGHRMKHDRFLIFLFWHGCSLARLTNQFWSSRLIVAIILAVTPSAGFSLDDAGIAMTARFSSLIQSIISLRRPNIYKVSLARFRDWARTIWPVLSKLMFNRVKNPPATAVDIATTEPRVMGPTLRTCKTSIQMSIAIAKGGNTQGERLAWMTQPPILWLRFFGWLGSGVGLGWLIRDLTSSAKVGAISWAIKLVIISAIISQLSIVIYASLQSRSGKRNE